MDHFLLLIERCITHAPFRATLLVGILALASPAASAQSHVAVTLECLSKLSWSELEDLYRQADAGSTPCGYYKGKAVYCRDRLFSRARSGVTDALWKGKHFSCGKIVNQWTGAKMLKGKVYPSTSWLDGKPALALDYRSTSLMWRNVRDEIREVAPGVYVGIMFKEKRCDRRIQTFFVLEAYSCPGQH